MSPPTSHPPQTSRQAKKEYLKKRANSRLSESDNRRLNRDVELHERAERIKSSEQRKKSNLRKKEEKMEKEREARRKAGLPEIREQYVSPRQKRLGAFVGLGKQIREEGGEEDTARKDQAQMPARSPLKAMSPNAVINRRSCGSASAPHTYKENDDFYHDDGAAKGLLSAITATTPTRPKKAHVHIVKTLTAHVQHPAELLALISTQDLQFSDDDGSSSSSKTLEAEKADDENGDDCGEEEAAEAESDFADADFEELAQDLGFGPPTGLNLSRELNNRKKNVPVANTPKIEKRMIQTPYLEEEEEGEEEKREAAHNNANDKIFDEFAPSSQDLLDLIEPNNDFDDFEISTQDIRFLDS